MWTFAGSDLKYRLTLRVAAVSALCFAAISAYFLVDADRRVHARIDGIAEITAKSLVMQQRLGVWGRSRANFPDLDLVATYLVTPGLCIAYRGNDGNIVQRSCVGPPSGHGCLRNSIARCSIPAAKRCGPSWGWTEAGSVTQSSGSIRMS
jgi:hypothetical protein